MLRISVVLFSLLFIASNASSDIFKYIDENGVTCYTDAPLGKKNQKVLAEKSNKVIPDKK